MWSECEYPSSIVQGRDLLSQIERHFCHASNNKQRIEVVDFLVYGSYGEKSVALILGI